MRRLQSLGFIGSALDVNLTQRLHAVRNQGSRPSRQIGQYLVGLHVLLLRLEVRALGERSVRGRASVRGLQPLFVLLQSGYTFRRLLDLIGFLQFVDRILPLLVAGKFCALVKVKFVIGVYNRGNARLFVGKRNICGDCCQRLIQPLFIFQCFACRQCRFERAALRGNARLQGLQLIES